jgi:hypothetical protein
MTLLVLSACAAHSAGQRPGAAAPPGGEPPPSANATPSASTTPPAATAAAAPEAPVAAVTQGEPPPPANGADEKMLPPCVPVRRTHVKHRKPKESPASQTPASIGPPPPAPLDAVVDAQVGQEDTSLSSILGKDVKSPKGENLGRVIDLLADARGHVRVAIIDFGGFLGVGTRRIAVDWPLLHFDPDSHDKPVILSVDRQKLQSAPEYNSKTPRVLMPPAAPDAADAGQTKK